MRRDVFNTTAAVGLALAAASVSLGAHDFWIQPSSFTPAIDTAVRVRLMVGDHFTGEPLPRNDRKIERFFALGPDGSPRDIVGRHGVDPAGIVRFEHPGLYVLGYDGRPSPVSLAPEAFEAYLKEEGLEQISRERRRLNERNKPGREAFSRSVKALVRAGTPSNVSGFDRAVGLPLEIIPEANPFAPDLQELPVRLLFEGSPLEEALLVVMRRGPSAGTKGEVVSTGRTGADGRASLRIAPGELLIKAVHMVRAPSGSEADWTSTWTSLTFERPTAIQAAAARVDQK
jgi:hypothetical protein